MAEIRIDQSHCNSWLVTNFERNGWTVLFTDPGRVSRGGSGSQGKALRIFEGQGLHIPDIVAVRGPVLCLIEIDTSFWKALPSLQSYRRDSYNLIDSIRNTFAYPAIHRLELGFCKTGLERNVPRTESRIKAQADGVVDHIITFVGPGEPVTNRLIASTLEDQDMLLFATTSGSSRLPAC